METQRRRRKNRSQLVGTLATVPVATGENRKPVERFMREPTHDEIARRAYQLHEERGRESGRDWQDWFQAERELRQAALHDLIDSILTTGSEYASA